MKHSQSDYLPVILAVDDAAELPRVIPESDIDRNVLETLLAKELRRFDSHYFAVTAFRGSIVHPGLELQYVAWFESSFVEDEDRGALWENGIRDGRLVVNRTPLSAEQVAKITDYASAQATYKAHLETHRHDGKHYPAKFWYQDNVYGRSETIKLVWEIAPIEGWLERPQSNLYGYPVVMYHKLPDGVDTAFAPEKFDRLFLTGQ